MSFPRSIINPLTPHPPLWPSVLAVLLLPVIIPAALLYHAVTKRRIP